MSQPKQPPPQQQQTTLVDDWFIPNQSRICTSPHPSTPPPPPPIITSAVSSILSFFTPTTSALPSTNASTTGSTISSAISSTVDLDALNDALGQSDLHPTSLLDRLQSTKPVCTLNLAQQICTHLPIRAKLTDSWHLIYSMDQHGISLSTLYRKLDQMQALSYVLMIQAHDGKIFGAYLSDALRVSQPHFFGTGESFVYQYDTTTNRILPYLWTGMNDYFIYGDFNYFAIGASDGNFAIWLDKDLQFGKSEPVATFNNPTLSTDTKFECYELEVWGIGR